MLRITVDLVPHGDESRVQPIGEMIIANDGTGSEEFSNYVFAMHDDKRGTDFGTIEDFYRNAGFWELIATCISEGSWKEHELTPVLLDRLILRNDKI
jgi:hypothetical protein